MQHVLHSHHDVTFYIALAIAQLLNRPISKFIR